ncbi:primosomal protein N' [Streptococcus sp. E17BB]|uniref:primosomal protein N' n=1 Tax=Streptococcus sp. E17BB TaxID=3278714 RepID=UPI00359D43FB
MPKIAQIIIDLPLKQTDQPYSYLVPDELVALIAVGSRVHVPFGATNRPLQGFVVGFEEIADQDMTLKPVLAVLDLEPVLNQEQLDLADALRRTVFSYKISLLKAMLPSLLNSAYNKVVKLTSIDLVSDLFPTGKKEMRLAELTADQQVQVKDLVKTGQAEVVYLATDKKQIKTVRYYQVNLDQLDRSAISSRATKRLELAEFLTKHPDDGKVSDLNKTFSPAVVNWFIEQGVLLVTEREESRSRAYFEGVKQTEFIQLNSQQQEAVTAVTAAIGQESSPFLLEGVTGSGKTEVYLHIIDQTLKMGKTAIVLVPEIVLTPQMTSRFISRFGRQVAIMHSGLSDGEKYDEWLKIRRGQAKVVVGARSAIFAPLENIGAIIIDEEHEATYKQESNPRYHARDVAVLRAKYHKAALVLGSATPAIESRARASKGVYQLLTLTERANHLAVIPTVEVVDFRDYIGQQEMGNFTPPLVEKIRDRLNKGEQVVLLLNRRGYSSFVMCRDCSYVDNCVNCDISLTLHMTTRTMNCHYCGFTKGIPRTCPNCQSASISYYGTGTQKAADELEQLFPETKVLRMDVDTTKKKGSHQKLLEAFGNGKADILLGTQMIAKGLDFPNVTLVGVLNADTSLNLPDFRASERTFQLLTQVAGRAGRADKAGEVIIQTYNPDHYAITFAKHHDYEGFYRYEMGIRRALGYPPYFYTVALTISHKDEQAVIKASYAFLDLLKTHLSDQVRYLGPVPKAVSRTHNLYHYQLLLTFKQEPKLQDALNQLLDLTQDKTNKDLRVSIDYEPQNIM